MGLRGTSSSMVTSRRWISLARRSRSSALATHRAIRTTSATPCPSSLSASKQGATIVGSVSDDDYEYEESKSCSGGKFVGLACDEDNQPEMSEDRVNAWIDQIKGEGMPL